MNCRNFQKRLEDYLEGGLDFAGRFAIERHAQQCFGCGKQISDAQKLSQMARHLSRVQAPPNFESALLDRIHRDRAKRRMAWFWRGWFCQFEWPSGRAMATAAVGLAIFITGLSVPIYLARKDQQTSPSQSIAQAQNEAASPEENSAKMAAPDPFDSSAQDQRSDEKKLASPIRAASNRARRAFSTEGDEIPAFVEPGSSEYVEYLVPGPGNSQMIVRLPSTIRMRYNPPSEAFFIRNVSH